MSRRTADVPLGTGVAPAPRRVSQDKGGTSDGIQVLSYVLSGLLLYGGLGWVADHWLHTTFLFPVGLILGAGLAMFMIIKRFGRSASAHEDNARHDSARKE